MFKEKEIDDFFKELAIDTDIKRQKILSQGDYSQKDESNKINRILIDKITVISKKDGFEDAELE
ncbi:hypothetical protein B6V01_002240 [Methanosarcinales archaeon ex4572_44]|nr:MAG: hypothetical protein B6V01_002240 [Methanosarcinales archaeon ex4572_44]RLG94135.1 MAG: hypothetical protein DRO37_06460 [Candidatus Bathyarchaeota archaeon]